MCEVYKNQSFSFHGVAIIDWFGNLANGVIVNSNSIELMHRLDSVVCLAVLGNRDKLNLEHVD